VVSLSDQRQQEVSILSEVQFPVFYKIADDSDLNWFHFEDE
jgi:hypothetical protein